MSFSSEVKNQLAEIVPKKDCCRKNIENGKLFLPFEGVCEKDLGCYLRGVFLQCGHISSPNRNFMLDFVCPDDEFAKTLSDLLEESGLSSKSALRKGKPVLYFKASESIEDLLAFIGATKAALEIMNRKIMSDVRNTANRICNAETANLDRTAKAAAEQCEAINIIKKHGAMHNLPPELRECAELRIANPDMSLNQLLELLHEPVSKSGLNHRFKKLIEIAETLER